MVQRRRVLPVVVDHGDCGYLLFRINVNRLFSSSQSQETKMRRLPAPVTRFATMPDRPERIDFALAGGGATLVGVSNQHRTVLHDAASGVTSEGPEMAHLKAGGTFVVPLGRRRLCAVKRRHYDYPASPDEPTEPLGETLVGGLAAGAWRALPDPPPDLIRSRRGNPSCLVTACYLAAGKRLWVSARDRGTYSVDTTARAADGWRKEGDWQLPFQCRGLLAPDLAPGLCFGLCPRTTRLCACDVRRSPPPVRYAWDDTRPCWPTSLSQENIATVARLPDSSLAYLGDGEFCIAWTIAISEDNSTISQRALWLMGVKIVKNSPSAPLRMLHHKSCIYELPGRALMAYALHAD
ncbi:hypothetical protein CFC21_090634 [Triticum aestivum]|uniref:DUF1618 domain-containing protein n=2 Tax=Triticum aestivum TaxID=4565 RepID=A0A9R1MS60_WHEAT|nr:hypothetical protein CFC21_090633 [Triticum aestivum]KAF7087449.1 hypothetical protein CFC21_090634 [Triticum aestivum]